MDKPNILIFDVETSTFRVAYETYQLKVYDRYINPKYIEREWVMLSAAWKWLGDNPVKCISVSPKDPFNDYEVVRALYDTVSQADYIIGHNLKAFDIKKLNTRAIMLDLPPIRRPIEIDTLKIARKHFSFPSNKLSYLAEKLGVTHKEESPDWEQCLLGNREALAHLRFYNKGDVITTEGCYLKLRGWETNHPNMGWDVRDIAGNQLLHCPTCGSGNTSKQGFKVLKNGRKRQRYQCQSCGAGFPGAIIYTPQK